MARMTTAQWWMEMEPARIALQRVLDGVPAIGSPVGQDDLGTIGMMFNRTWLRLRRIPGRKPDLILLEEAVKVLEGLSIHVDIPHPEPADGHLLKEAMNLCDRTVRVATTEQWATTGLELLKNAGRTELA
jgi:hypothetical protein